LINTPAKPATHDRTAAAYLPLQLADAPTGSPAHGRVVYLDGQALKHMVWSGYVWLEQHREIVNALNVFPVPDGDTGTNMYLTMRAAWNEIAKSEEDNIGRIAQAAAQGALMGARGNSGVILSQILRGMAHVFRNKDRIDAHDMVAGLQRGSETAYKGVVKPVEGTILTVVREAAAAAQKAAAVDQDLRFVLDHTVQAAQETVERTPTLLPVLAKAGVVDSGGKGLYYILEGMLRGLCGEDVATAKPSPEAVPTAAAAGVIDPFNLPPIRFGFDIQFLIWGAHLNVNAIRKRISELGDYALVEGSGAVVKVHVHAFDPSAPLAYGYSQGFLTDVVIENMDAMAAAGNAPEDVKDMLSTAPPAVQIMEGVEGIGVIAVAPGPGLRQVFESLGVGAVVSGGQTMNPSTEELLQAITALPTDDCILLPNNSNILLAARQAQQLTHKRVEVVPSRTVPQGISALLAFNLQASLAENVAIMNRALTAIATGEVTVAVRDASIDGVDVRAGDIIGLLNDTLTTKGQTPQEVVHMLLAQMDAHQAEMITVYYGQDVDADTAEALGVDLAAVYPEQEIEVISGGQPHYHFIISAE
jgi:hypothetical protein